MEQRYLNLELDRLQESSTNPRRTFEGLHDITESVKQHGVLTPLLVRPVNGHFEIIAGARRFRAALSANISEVPCIVRDMNDHEALDIQIIDNLQREDIHPLEEASGYQQLMERNGYSVEDIAAKISKSPSYVYQRLKLVALSEKAQEKFLDGTMTAGHAIQLARLRPEQQAEALATMKAHEDMSVRELGDYIHNQFHLSLAEAPFSTTDAELLPQAGSCKECLKRSGANPQLFPDIKKKDVCTDAVCFHAKEAALVERGLAEATDDAVKLTVGTAGYRQKEEFLTGWVKAEKGCGESAQVGVIAQVLQRYEAESLGLKLGQIVRFCKDAKCPVHGRTALKSKKSPSTAKADKARKMELKRRGAIFQRLVMHRSGDLEVLTDDEDHAILKYATSNLSTDEARAFCNAMGWTVKTDKFGGRNWHGAIESYFAKEGMDPMFATFLVTVAAQDLYFYNGADTKPKLLEAAAETRGIDVKAVARELEKAQDSQGKAEDDAEAEEPEKPQARRKAKTAKAKKPGKKKAA